MFEKVSIQSCEGSSGKSRGNYDRLGREAIYAFVYPNFMINRCLLFYLGIWLIIFSVMFLLILEKNWVFAPYLFCKLACFYNLRCLLA